jgi:hypothetical protein
MAQIGTTPTLLVNSGSYPDTFYWKVDTQANTYEKFFAAISDNREEDKTYQFAMPMLSLSRFKDYDPRFEELFISRERD